MKRGRVLLWGVLIAAVFMLVVVTHRMNALNREVQTLRVETKTIVTDHVNGTVLWSTDSLTLWRVDLEDVQRTFLVTSTGGIVEVIP